MSRIFITGSSDGLGLAAAQYLSNTGHDLVLHARSPSRAQDAQKACPAASACLIADLSSFSAVRKLADDLNSTGPYDTIIYNAGLYRGGFNKTDHGLPALIAVNTMATYMLTCLVRPPGDIGKAIESYELLGTKTEESGKYYRPGKQEAAPKEEANEVGVQDNLLKICEEITGIKFPES